MESFVSDMNNESNYNDIGASNGDSKGKPYTFDRQNEKGKVSLEDIQYEYFELIAKQFDRVYENQQNNNLTSHDLAQSLSRNRNDIDELLPEIEPFVLSIIDFWNKYADVLYFHLEDKNDVHKAMLGEDYLLYDDSDWVSKYGIYIDTSIILDPFVGSQKILLESSKDQRVYSYVKFGLDLINNKCVVNAHTDNPILVVAPNRAKLKKNFTRVGFKKEIENDTLRHTSRLFGRGFESQSELIMYCDSITTIEKLLDAIKKPSLLGIPFSDGVGYATQIKSLVEQCNEARPDLSCAFHICNYISGRLKETNSLLYDARRMNATPILSGTDSWKYYNWKLEYGAKGVCEVDSAVDLHVTHSIQNHFNNKLQWLENVPLDILIEMRKIGAISEIRDILGNGINEIAVANHDDYSRTSAKVFRNFDNAFSGHQKKLDELKQKKWAFAKCLSSCLVCGSILVASAFSENPLVRDISQVSDAYGYAFGFSSIKDTIKCVKQLSNQKQQQRQLMSSPVGMLFNCKKHS